MIIYDDYVFDELRGIYVARELLKVDDRVKTAAKVLEFSKDNEEKYFAKALLSPYYYKMNRVDVTSFTGIECILGELSRPVIDNLSSNREFTSRIMTSKEYRRYFEFAKNHDKVMYGSMSDCWGELVFDSETGKYQLASAFFDEIDIDDVSESLLKSPSCYGIWYGVREVIEIG